MTGVLHVYQDANITRQIRTLLKGGANAASAARHAQTIIDRFIDGGICDPKLMGRLTHYGEARIRNCVKFDLVRGYRLIGILLDEGIAFVYVGSHDECDHWIRNNAGLEPILDKKRNKVAKVNIRDAVKTSAESQSRIDPSEPDYDEMLLKDLTDQDLRKIFSGLLAK